MERAGSPSASGLARRWLERVVQDYPEKTALRLQREEDRFRNPVGYTLREGLAVLAEEILGDMDVERMAPALDGIVRIRAVQDFTAAQAVSFVFQLREAARESLDAAACAKVERRIDEVALLAFDVFMRCREKLYEIKAGEMRRSIYMQERIRALR